MISKKKMRFHEASSSHPTCLLFPVRHWSLGRLRRHGGLSFSSRQPRRRLMADLRYEGESVKQGLTCVRYISRENAGTQSNLCQYDQKFRSPNDPFLGSETSYSTCRISRKNICQLWKHGTLGTHDFSTGRVTMMLEIVSRKRSCLTGLSIGTQCQASHCCIDVSLSFLCMGTWM